MATKSVNIRVPGELHALVKASAGADHRSLNSQVIWLLEAGLASRDEHVQVRTGTARGMSEARSTVRASSPPETGEP